MTTDRSKRERVRDTVLALVTIAVAFIMTLYSLAMMGGLIARWFVRPY